MNNTYCNQSGFQPPMVSMIPRGTHKVQFNIQSTFQVILWPFVSSGVSVNGRRIGSLRTHCHCYTTFLYSKLFSMSSSRRPRFLSESFEALFSPATAASGSAQTTPNESLLLGYLRLTMQSLPRSFLHLFIFEIRFQIANVTSPDLARRVSLGKVRFNFNWSICNDVNDINCSTNWGGCKKAKRLS